MIYYKVKLNLLALLFLCALVISSCNSVSRNDQIIQKLQKQVPFTLVVPTYLPTGFYAYPTEIGEPTKGSNDYVELRLIYQKRGFNKNIGYSR
jgi:hypothetical protein